MGTTAGKPAKADPVEQGAKTGRLALADAKLKAVPARVWLIGERLRSLDLSGNSLEELTSQIGALPKLQTLKLSRNLLTQLPDELYHLNELRVLLADHNRLHTVAAVLPRQKLRTLDLSHNNFSGAVGHPFLALPPCVTTCSLAGNRIQAFNESFGFELLGALEELDLDANEVVELPEQVGSLRSLICLKLRNNRVRTLPSALFTGTKLNRLHLEGNPITLAHLRDIEGFDAFLERRKGRLSKGIAQGLHVDHSVCGLAE